MHSVVSISKVIVATKLFIYNFKISSVERLYISGENLEIIYKVEKTANHRFVLKSEGRNKKTLQLIKNRLEGYLSVEVSRVCLSTNQAEDVQAFFIDNKLFTLLTIATYLIPWTFD